LIDNLASHAGPDDQDEGDGASGSAQTSGASRCSTPHCPEFGERGYHAASTGSIAKRAGISQPYIYALFSDKRELFRAVHDRVVGEIRAAFDEAVRGAANPEEALEAMGHAYRPLMEDERLLRAQLQCTAAAAGDPELRGYVGASFRGLVEHVARLSGADPASVASFHRVRDVHQRRPGDRAARPRRAAARRGRGGGGELRAPDRRSLFFSINL
jgi:AcrR family transcriptional regulator